MLQRCSAQALISLNGGISPTVQCGAPRNTPDDETGFPAHQGHAVPVWTGAACVDVAVMGK
jgi:hypothetical protein